MQTELFKSYEISALKATISAGIRSIKKSVEEEADVKHANDVTIPKELRASLGVAESVSVISLEALQAIVNAPTTELAGITEDVRRMMVEAQMTACFLLEMGQRQKPQGLSFEQRQKITNSQKAIAALTSWPHPAILLSDEESKAASSCGMQKKIVQATMEEEQKDRQRANQCAAALHREFKERPISISVEVYHDPGQLAAIEELLRYDGLGAWLLKEVQAIGMPTLLCKYRLPSFLLEAIPGLEKAFYYSQDTTYTNQATGISQSIKTREFVAIFTNHTTGNDDAATSYGHELRHVWQAEAIPRAERHKLSKLDQIICMLLCEADAQAVGNKIGASIQRKMQEEGKTPTISPSKDMCEYEKVFEQLSGETIQVRTKKATQAAFIGFLKDKGLLTAYLQDYMAAMRPEERQTLCRDAANGFQGSKVLTNQWLKRISQVGSVSYLDEGGRVEIRNCLTKELSKVLGDAAEILAHKANLG
jgi:hypothetical protein